MNINIALYKNLLPQVKIMLDRDLPKGLAPEKIASELSRAYSCPQIATHYMVAAFVGMNDDLLDSIRRFVEFYGYEEVLGIKEINEAAKLLV